jgi:gluconate 5-dehydrogenase
VPDVKELFDLSGKVALVTGGSRGLGAEMAEGLAEAGARLFLLARREQWLDPTLQYFRKRGFACQGAVCDVSKQDQVRQAVEKAIAAYEKIDILVNNAGISWGAKAEETPIEKWQEVLDVNLTGAWLFCQTVGKHMIERRGGNIINIASIAGLRGAISIDTSVIGYTASKAGLLGITRELAARWAAHGIRVNAVAPGFFPSRMTEKLLARVRKEYEARVPMGRIGNSGELKGTIVFLASEASSYITGQTIVVDGGATIV